MAGDGGRHEEGLRGGQRCVCARTGKALVWYPEGILSSFASQEVLVLRASPCFKLKLFLLRD